jgi:hypothetical protein
MNNTVKVNIYDEEREFKINTSLLEIARLYQFKEEYDLPEIYTDPLPEVVSALRYYSHTSELMQNLPDHERS